MMLAFRISAVVVLASSLLTGCVSGLLLGVAIHDAPESYEGPKATEPHAEVRLVRTFSNIPLDRLDRSTKIGGRFVSEGDSVVARLAPGRARWSFVTNVADSPISTSGPPVAHLRGAPIASCNLSQEFAFEAGRTYRLAYAFEGHNQCRITCVDTTETAQGTSCH